MAGWSSEVLDAARGRCDPYADEVVAALVEGGQIRHANELLRSLINNHGIACHSGAASEANVCLTSNSHLPPADWPLALRGFLENFPKLTEEQALALAKGQEVFATHGPEILTVLLFYALPAAYAAEKGAKVLHRTGQLQEGFERRVLETAQMLLDVMRPGGFEYQSDRRGLNTVQKVRLMHAAVRTLLREDQKWRQLTEERVRAGSPLGEPINQEDLAGTLTTFSFLTLDGLERLGVYVSSSEREDYVKAWGVIGALLGIEADLIATNFDEARELAETVLRRQVGDSAEGRELAAALLKTVENRLPGRVLDPFGAALVHRFWSQRPVGGTNVAQLLGVRRADRWFEWALGPFTAVVGAVLDRLGLRTSAVTRQLMLELLDLIILPPRAGRDTAFQIPSELKRRWGAPTATSGS